VGAGLQPRYLSQVQTEKVRNPGPWPIRLFHTAPGRHQNGTVKAPDPSGSGTIFSILLRSPASIIWQIRKSSILTCLAATSESPPRSQRSLPFLQHLRRILAAGRRSGIFPHFYCTFIASVLHRFVALMP